MTRPTSGQLYAIAALLYDFGEYDAARKQYEAADALLVSEAYEREATDLERPALPTLVAPPPEAP